LRERYATKGKNPASRRQTEVSLLAPAPPNINPETYSPKKASRSGGLFSLEICPVLAPMARSVPT
jgi:hypothetical protein